MTNQYQLGSVDFASDEAREEAIRAGLTDADFEGVEPDRESGISVARVRETATQKAEAGTTDDDGPAYRVSTWLGNRSYHCRRCPYGTLDEAEIKRHVAAH